MLIRTRWRIHILWEIILILLQLKVALPTTICRHTLLNTVGKGQLNMRILDENGNEITNPDLDLGHLEQEEIVTQHHDAIPANPGSFHYKVIREYPNGGKDVEQVWDVEPTEAVAAWDETEIIQRYILYTQEELGEIAARKRAEEEAAA